MFDEAPKAIKIGGHTIYKESYNQRDILESSVSSGRTTSTGGNGRSALIQIYDKNKNMTTKKTTSTTSKAECERNVTIIR